MAIRKEGDAVILEPVGKRKWPAGYWQRIDRRAKDLDLGRVVPIGGLYIPPPLLPVPCALGYSGVAPLLGDTAL